MKTKYFITLPVGKIINQWEVLSEPFIGYTTKKKSKYKEKETIYDTNVYQIRCKCLICSNEYSVVCYSLESGKSKCCKKCGSSHKKQNNPNWQGYKDMPKTSFHLIKESARKRNLKFLIDMKYCWELFEKQNRKCVLTGLDLIFNCGTRNSGTASLDRIDSSKGYEEGNVQWVHKHINIMKNQFDQNYFIKMCRLVSTT